MHPYSSIILNELHYHLPELLYRSERFENIQDILQYVVSVARDNRFEREQSRYLSTYQPYQSQDEKKDENERERGYSRYDLMALPSAYAEVQQLASPVSSSPSSSASSRASSRASSPVSSASSSVSCSSTSSVNKHLPDTNIEHNHTSIFQRRNMPFLSSAYTLPASSVLQGLNQFQDVLRPVIVRPTQQHLSDNTFVYRSDVSLNDNCSVCQDPMEVGQETRTILACNHCFHRECIDRWFQEHVQCPTCRHDVRDS